MMTSGGMDDDDHGQTERAMTIELCETIARNDYFRFEDDDSDRSSRPPTSNPTLTKKLVQLIKAMASSDMDSKQTEAYLTSQMKRRRPRPKPSQDELDADASTLTETQAAALTEFWMANRTRIHDAMVRRSYCPSPTYRSMAWTISDIVPQSPARHHRSAVASHVQIVLKDEQKASGVDVMDFRVDGTDAKRIVKVLGEIDARLLATTSKI